MACFAQKLVTRCASYSSIAVVAMEDVESRIILSSALTSRLLTDISPTIKCPFGA